LFLKDSSRYFGSACGPARISSARVSVFLFSPEGRCRRGFLCASVCLSCSTQLWHLLPTRVSFAPPPSALDSCSRFFFRPATKARCATFSIFCRVRFTVEARRRVPISRLGFGVHFLVFFPSAAAGGSVLSEQAPSGRFRAVSRHAAPHQGSPPPRPSVVPMEPC
jgi:hypothetical protein